jgi:hypothetical protein
MKFLESHFEDYIVEQNKYNLHKELVNIYNDLPDTLENHNNLILYGPKGCGKYTQALTYIQKFSPTNLKYERRMFVDFQKKNYTIKISDVHFEIDMDLLGCHAKLLWNTIYYHILDILNSRQERHGIILCKNFHTIHSELLDIFYSYMQTLKHKNIDLTYIILTEQTSFIPDNILNRSIIVPVKRATKEAYGKCIGKVIPKTIILSKINNIKNLKTRNYDIMKSPDNYSKRLINIIENYKTLQFIEIRNTIYNLLIYGIDVPACLWLVVVHFIKNKKLTGDNINLFLEKLYSFFKYYNNNYRPIYHLESIIYYLINIVHEL